MVDFAAFCFFAFFPFSFLAYLGTYIALGISDFGFFASTFLISFCLVLFCAFVFVCMLFFGVWGLMAGAFFFLFFSICWMGGYGCGAVRCIDWEKDDDG